jgi:hypothetical protein
VPLVVAAPEVHGDKPVERTLRLGDDRMVFLVGEREGARWRVERGGVRGPQDSEVAYDGAVYERRPGKCAEDRGGIEPREEGKEPWGTKETAGIVIRQCGCQD